MKILIGGQVSLPSEILHWISRDISDEILSCSSKERLLASLLVNIWDLLLLYLTDSDRDEPGKMVAEIRGVLPHVPIILLFEESRTGWETTSMPTGVSEMIHFPVSRSSLVEKVQRVINFHHDSAEASFLSREKHQKSVIPEEVLFGQSSGMLDIKRAIHKIKDTDIPILITGESGTGKEVIAKFLWQISPRSDRPFVKVNCAAIPSELLESELFGFEKGAFTGAYRRKPGRFETANGGYLFLDEVSELPYSLQSKLLHVLQDGKFSPLGSTTDGRTNARIIAATNRLLDQAVHLGTFRKDLYFRLNVVNLHLPPLRSRKDQIHVLSDYFRHRFADQYQVPVIELSEDTISLLFYHSWPGNIRELENVIRRATVLGDQRVILEELKDIPDQPQEALPADSDGHGSRPSTQVHEEHLVDRGMSLKSIAKQATLEAERQAIEQALRMTRWNRKKAASLLDVSYKTLLSKIKEMGIDNA
ncbi:MAG: sigma-54-dependent Fis family transcriptional regulator [bacterium]|nr:MAG: sigma-54-dependent Fis family transcriptional regulator [bacterium]